MKDIEEKEILNKLFIMTPEQLKEFERRLKEELPELFEEREER